MLIAIVAILATAAILPALYRRWPGPAALLAPAVAAAVFSWLAARSPAALGDGPVTESWTWSGSLGVSAAFALDGLGLLFALLITGIGALILLYSRSYLKQRERLGAFLALLLLFMASMLGLVLADDAITLFVFWELTSISSFFLIGFESDSPRARKNALQALILTAGGGLALLVGLLLLGAAAADAGLTGTDARRLSALAALDLRDHPLYTSIVILVALAAFTKSAHVPFHFWLPNAMVAPTPVSAYLHSATMVKAGVFLLARLNPTLGGTGEWMWILGAFGALTMVSGALLAVVQRDMKLVLAYSTMSILGTLTLLIGIGTPAALQAFAVYVVAHALYKAALFMVVGNVDKQCKRRDLWTLRALGKRLPATGGVAILAGASMAGLPPLVGYLAKEELYGAALGAGAAPLFFAAAAFIAGALTITAALLVVVPPFFRGRTPSHQVGEAPRPMVGAPALLALLGVALGLWLHPLENLAGAAARAVGGAPVEVDLALWHGVASPYGEALLMSAASLVLAALAYWRLSAAPPSHEPIPPPLRRLLPSTLYDRGTERLWVLADLVGETLQSGLLRRYLFVTICAAVAAVGVPLLIDLRIEDIWSAGAGFYEIFIVLLAAAGAVKTITATDRLTAIAAIGVVGLAIAFLFALLSAPDLAITQLMVETLMVILLVLVFRRLPPATRQHPASKRRVYAAVAAAGGGLVSLLVLTVGRLRFHPEASNFFIANAEEQHGANVVNTILVNFRALDTLGEIIVLAIAGIGVYALLRLHPGSEAEARTKPREEDE